MLLNLGSVVKVAVPFLGVFEQMSKKLSTGGVCVRKFEYLCSL